MKRVPATSEAAAGGALPGTEFHPELSSPGGSRRVGKELLPHSQLQLAFLKRVSYRKHYHVSPLPFSSPCLSTNTLRRAQQSPISIFSSWTTKRTSPVCCVVEWSISSPRKLGSGCHAPREMMTCWRFLVPRWPGSTAPNRSLLLDRRCFFARPLRRESCSPPDG